MGNLPEIKNDDNSLIWSTERVETLLRKIEDEGLDYKQIENPFHDQNPDLKKANIQWEYTPEEILEIKKCAEDVSYFSKYCKVMTDNGMEYIKLRDYQDSVLREYQSNRFNIFLAPRQVGKCFLPTTHIIGEKNRNVSINSLRKTKKFNILYTIKKKLYKIYSLL